ncbi:MAG: hypothetical protein V3S55_15365 [Nitrospiraceae bacterium]
MPQQNLTSLPTTEILGIYNGLTGKSLKSWKRSRSILIDRINKMSKDTKSAAPKAKKAMTTKAKKLLGSTATSDVASTRTEKPVSGEITPDATGNDADTRTIREAALEWMSYVAFHENRDEKSGPDNRHDAAGDNTRTVGITYLEIIDRIKAEFAECQTSVACLRWYAVKVRAEEPGYEGYRLPQRRPRATPKRS